MSEANPKGEYQDDTSKVGHCQTIKYKKPRPLWLGFFLFSGIYSGRLYAL